MPATRHARNKVTPFETAAQRFRAARAAASLSQTEAADEASVVLTTLDPYGRGLSREIMRKYEDDGAYEEVERQPEHILRVIAIAKVYGVEPSWLAPSLPVSDAQLAKIQALATELRNAWPH